MNMGDIFGLAGKMKEMQARMQEAQENLGKITETGEAGAGMVQATVNGKKQILKIEIDDELLKGNDKEILQDLIVAATNKALEKVEEKAKEELKKSTEGLIPNIPGMDLGSMFGK
ncbi:YbaB/EbfC family nucleoid-associated protein [Emticicia fluvialis]|uniref:YbaB/EbfC family nucleoid-associated protein n=1 Tax=Emticicia fluvialis TaxID=2974474 RepID=UPI0021663977|nr:YbaB/EbfC family nucleoid-associated protein [Emticicia fluvialis]